MLLFFINVRGDGSNDVFLIYNIQPRNCHLRSYTSTKNQLDGTPTCCAKAQAGSTILDSSVASCVLNYFNVIDYNFDT